MKKPIVLSSHAMRFYVHHGWTREELEACLEKGSLIEKDAGLEGFHYFLLEPYSKFDVEKLKQLVSEVYPTFPDHPNYIDEAIREFNW